MSRRAVQPAGRRRRGDIGVAAAVWLLATAALLAAPALRGEAHASVPPLGSGAWWAALLLGAAQAVALLWRSSHPGPVLVVVALAPAIAASCGAGDTVSLTYLAVLVASYTVAATAAVADIRPPLIGAAALVVIGELVTRLRLHGTLAAALGTAVLQTLAVVVAPVVVGLVVVARRDARRAREDARAAAEREREARLDAAVSHERMAMARELHDIAAHHLSGIAVMTAAIGTQIDTDPAAAKQAVADVREQTRTLLRDLRSLVGLLRDRQVVGDVRPDRAQHRLDAISDLIDDIARSGVPVELSVLSAAGGDLGAGVGPLAQLAAYRVVQEALANAARHAMGARCRVVIDDRDPRAVVISVRNAAPAQTSSADRGGGYGLVGMRERAELTGAELRYGPTDDGGWEVRLALPRQTDTVTSHTGQA